MNRDINTGIDYACLLQNLNNAFKEKRFGKKPKADSSKALFLAIHRISAALLLIIQQNRHGFNISLKAAFSYITWFFMPKLILEIYGTGYLIDELYMKDGIVCLG